MELSGAPDGELRSAADRRFAEKEVMIVKGELFARSSLPGR